MFSKVWKYFALYFTVEQITVKIETRSNIFFQENSFVIVLRQISAIALRANKLTN